MIDKTKVFSVNHETKFCWLGDKNNILEILNNRHRWDERPCGLEHTRKWEFKDHTVPEENNVIHIIEKEIDWLILFEKYINDITDEQISGVSYEEDKRVYFRTDINILHDKYVMFVYDIDDDECWLEVFEENDYSIITLDELLKDGLYRSVISSRMVEGVLQILCKKLKLEYKNEDIH